jgi:hypothetical protein
VENPHVAARGVQDGKAKGALAPCLLLGGEHERVPTASEQF